jgi:hypothetical protein
MIKLFLIVAGVLAIGAGGLVTAICIGVHTTTNYD